MRLRSTNPEYVRLLARLVREAQAPLFREYVRRALAKHGNPTDPRAKARALLDEIRRPTSYTADPVAEAQTAIDADERAALAAAAFKELGFGTRIVAGAQSARPTPGLHHILLQYKGADGQWHPFPSPTSDDGEEP